MPALPSWPRVAETVPDCPRLRIGVRPVQTCPETGSVQLLMVAGQLVTVAEQLRLVSFTFLAGLQVAVADPLPALLSEPWVADIVVAPLMFRPGESAVHAVPDVGSCQLWVAAGQSKVADVAVTVKV